MGITRRKRTETGPRWESHNPGKGCNSTHVARSRRAWKRIKNRTLRRTGKQCPTFRGRGRPPCFYGDDDGYEDM